MATFDELLSDIKIPKFYTVTNQMDSSHIEDIKEAVVKALKRPGTIDRIKPGASVCLTAGSRDVANIDRILRALCDELKAVGAKPFIIPAMGSHAGADAKGQAEILKGYNITEESMGVPIKASMDTDVVATLDNGLEIHMDHYANEADFVIPVGRIKAHTDFHGPVESGICKMIVIGMGKQHGAYQCHKMGFPNMPHNVMEFASRIIEAKPNMFGIGIIENAYHNTCRIEAVPADKILEEEPKLLEYAKSRMAQIPFDQVDILFVDKMGKDISGAGMDPNITGRSPGFGKLRPFIQRIAVFDLTDNSHGNFGGIGNADVTTMRLFKKCDFSVTYPNCITCAEPTGTKLPIIMDSDRTCMKMALRTATDLRSYEDARIVWLTSTLGLSEFKISEALKEDALNNPNIFIISGPKRVDFDEAGNINRK